MFGNTNSVHYALLLVFIEEFENEHWESGVPMPEEIKNEIYKNWYDQFQNTEINLNDFSSTMVDVRRQALDEFDKAEKRELDYYNKKANEENARIVWLCGGTESEIAALKRGEMIENFDMYREKFKRFQEWKELHQVTDVPDHFVSSDFREWEEQMKTPEDYQNYLMDLDFYI